MLEALVASGAQILTAELPMIDGGDVAAIGKRIAPLASRVDAFNVTDNSAAHAHASNVAVAIALRQLGHEPIMQVVCRDKNRLALQADIVGAALHGVTNICCLTGDDVTAGDEPEARRVFDLDGPQLIQVATALGNGRYLSGRGFDPPRLFVGSVENPAAPPHEARVRRAAKKIGAGARFLQLQICYYPDRLEAFMAEAHRLGLTERAAFLPTILVLRSPKRLRSMHEKVPGIHVPEHLITRAEAVPGATYELALEQARHALSLPGVRGLHLAGGPVNVSRLLTDLGVRHAHDPQLAV